MSDALFINADTGEPEYAAHELRRGFSVILYKGVILGQPNHRFGARGGVHPSGLAAVTLAGSTITIRDLCAVITPGTTSQAGPYLVQIPEHTHALESPDNTNPRRDVVILRVYDDDEDSSTRREAVTEYIAGTPAASPTEPGVPTGAMRLASVDVPADGGGEPSLAYNAPFTVAAGGVLPVRGQSERPQGGLYDGLTVWRQDIKALEVYDAQVGSWLRQQFELPDAVKVWNFDSQVLTGITSTDYAPTSGGFGVSFVAPRSGIVLATWGGMVRIESDVATRAIFLSCEIRTGATIGGGTQVVSASDQHAIRHRKVGTASTQIAEDQGIMVRRVTGLTPGATYHVRLQHRASGGTDGFVAYRRVIVEPWG